MGYKLNGTSYKNASAGREKLQPGGHKCVIKKITLGKDKKGVNDQFVIMFDTANDDAQPGFFMNKYVESNKWNGNFYLTAGNDYFVSNVKKLVTAAEDSNDGFVGGEFSDDDFDFFYEKFVDLPIGIVFREEEFIPSAGRPDGSLPLTVKPYYFCDIKKVLNESVPEIRRIPAEPVTDENGFMAVPDGLEDEGLPFM